MKGKGFSGNFGILILGQALSLTGNSALRLALSLYALDLTGSAAAFSGLLALSMLPMILLSPLGGALADRVNRRNMMVALDGLSALMALTAALALPFCGGMGLAGALLMALSALGAFETPTVQACVPQMLPAEKLIRGNAAVAQVQAAASMAAPFLGSAAYAALGLRAVLWGAGVCFALTALLECRIRLRPLPRAKAGGVLDAIRADFRDGLRFLRRDEPGILHLSLLAALANLFVAGSTAVGLPYLVRSVLKLPASHYGAAESAVGAATILGGAYVGLRAQRLRPERMHRLFIGCGFCLIPAGAAFLPPLGAMARYWALTAALCACQFIVAQFSTRAVSAIQARTPDALMGRVMSCVMALSMCAQPAGQLAYGALFDRFAGAPQLVLLPSGAVVCAVGLLSAGFFRRFADAPRADEES